VGVGEGARHGRREGGVARSAASEGEASSDRVRGATRSQSGGRALHRCPKRLGQQMCEREELKFAYGNFCLSQNNSSGPHRGTLQLFVAPLCREHVAACGRRGMRPIHAY
jgi:hypothetical protein